MLQVHANYISMALMLCLLAVSTYLIRNKKANYQAIDQLRYVYFLMAFGWLISLNLSNNLYFSLATILGACFCNYFAAYPFVRSGKKPPKLFLWSLFILSSLAYIIIIYLDLSLKYFYTVSAVYITVGMGYGLYYLHHLDLGNFNAHKALAAMYSLTIFVVVSRLFVYLYAEDGFAGYKPVYDYIWGFIYLGLALMVIISYFEETVQLTYDMAITDELSWLLNRRGFKEEMAKRYGESHAATEGFSLLLLDIDNFKAINDTYGHEKGDEVIQTLASTLHIVLPEDVLAARFGGEEFVVVLPQTPLHEAKVIAENIRRLISRSPIVCEKAMKGFHFTISGGLTYCYMYSSLSGSLKIADDLMYVAKQNGKNQIRSVE